MTAFGTTVLPTQAETAVRGQLQFWMDTYLREIERLTGRAPLALPAIKNWGLASGIAERFPEQQLPGVMVTWNTSSLHGLGGSVNATYEMEVYTVIQGPTFEACRELASLYTWALTWIITQQFPGIAPNGVAITDASVPAVGLPEYQQLAERRWLCIGTCDFMITIDNVLDPNFGPTLPDPGPIPPGDFPETEEVTVSLNDDDVEFEVGSFDNFDRSDGPLGISWHIGTDPAITISGHRVVGPPAVLASAARIGELYDDDHYSEITITADALPLAAFIGPAVRMQNNNNNCYAAIYFHDDQHTPNYVIQLFKRVNGTYTDIDPITNGGNPGYALTAPLVVGDKLRLSVAGSELTITVNGTRVTKIIDSSVPAGGGPGIASFGVAFADDWSGGSATIETPSPALVFTSSPPNTGNSGLGNHVKVLKPTDPTPGLAHNFLYVLPVDADGVTQYGDAIDMLYGLNAHNEFNLTIVEPNFAIGSWYINASNPGAHPTYMHETYMVSDLVPWVTANFSTGTEEHRLLGFSRSGWGGINLLMRHPTVFAKGAFWDFPFGDNGTAIMGMGFDALYGNAAYLDANYVQNNTWLDTYKVPFQSSTRLWIAGYAAFQAEMAAAETQLTAKGILHSTSPTNFREHHWSSGWVAEALAALAAM